MLRDLFAHAEWADATVWRASMTTDVARRAGDAAAAQRVRESPGDRAFRT
jgi:hypothetical protein